LPRALPALGGSGYTVALLRLQNSDIPVWQHRRALLVRTRLDSGHTGDGGSG